MAYEDHVFAFADQTTANQYVSGFRNVDHWGMYLSKWWVAIRKAADETISAALAAFEMPPQLYPARVWSDTRKGGAF